MSPFTLPEPAAYLELLKNLEHPDYDSAQRENFDRIWDYIVKWLELREPRGLVEARPIIRKIARRLKDHPRLLYGLNCILQPHFRIECLTMQPTITFYVLVAKGHCEIQTVSIGLPSFPSTQKDLQSIMYRNELWEEIVGPVSDAERLACIAQVLQEILDDPSSEEACRLAARKRLYRFGKMGILPPSIFIHFVTPPPTYEHSVEHSESGGLCDAHKITVNSVPLCFRVVRQWLTSDCAKIYEQFCRELSVWRQLKHPNILPLIGATTEAFPRRYCFIVPWLLHGSIMSYLDTHPTHDRYLAISQIVDGVSYLHSLDPPVIHKDLKGENVLVRSDLVCVITDFGLSRLLDTQHTRTAGVSGTYFWMPPELFDDDGDESLPRDARPRDVYSLGCTIAQILIGKAPKFIWSAVIRREEPSLPPPKSPIWHRDELHLWDLVKKCIRFSPDERPTIQQVKRHLEVVRQSEPSRFELSQSSYREVDRSHLVGWIKSLPTKTALKPHHRSRSIPLPLETDPYENRDILTSDLESKHSSQTSLPTLMNNPPLPPSYAPTNMAEYDYSPEAAEAYLFKQRKIANWVDNTNISPPSNPFTPATPAVQTLALREETHKEERRHRKRESKDSHGRTEKEKVRGDKDGSRLPPLTSSRHQSSSKTPTPPKPDHQRSYSIPRPVVPDPFQTGNASSSELSLPIVPPQRQYPVPTIIMNPGQSYPPHSGPFPKSLVSPPHPVYGFAAAQTGPNVTGYPYLSAPQFPRSYYNAPEPAPKPAPLIKRLFKSITGGNKQQQQ